MLKDTSLTDAQEKILSLVPIIPALVSIGGSAAIICVVLRDKLAGPPYKRLLFGLSVCDVVGSTSFMLQAFLLPRDTSSRVWALGSNATCAAGGATMQLGLGTFFYIQSLSIWYVASIRFGVRTATFSKYIEPWLHMVSIGFPLSTAFYGIIVGMFNEMEMDLGCWVSNYPEGCGLDESIPCKSTLYAYMFAGYPFTIACVLILTNMLLIVAHVWNLSWKTSPAATTDDHNRNKNRRARLVAVQSFLFAAAFLFTMIPSAVLMIVEAPSLGFISTSSGISDEQQVFPLLVAHRILYPSVGILNLMVFLRPQYIRVRARRKHWSRFDAFRKAMKDILDVVPLTRRRALERQDVKTSQYMTTETFSALPWFQRIYKSSRNWHHSSSVALSRESSINCVVEGADGTQHNNKRMPMDLSGESQQSMPSSRASTVDEEAKDSHDLDDDDDDQRAEEGDASLATET